MTLAIADEGSRRGVESALRGPGAPSGILDVRLAGGELTVEFDDSVTSAALVRHLIEIELASRDAAIPGDLEALARIAARGLQDPDLDERRVIEWHL